MQSIEEIKKAIEENKSFISKEFDWDNPYSEHSSKSDLVLFGNVCALEWVLYSEDKDP